MQATYPDGSRMTDRQVRDEVLTLTSTGHETIGDALGWTCYLLEQHPHVEERLQAEIQHVLGGRQVVAEDFSRLRYTGMVLSESLRLYPPTWIYSRVPLANDVLPSEREVKKGWTLYLCPYVLHRHPEYFHLPERFNPDRFGDDQLQQAKLAYFPFGGGAHTCIGEALARLEGVLVLATIGQHIRFERVGGKPVVPKAGVTLFPKGGIQMRAVTRAAGGAP